jgi:hypothetical protein
LTPGYGAVLQPNIGGELLDLFTFLFDGSEGARTGTFELGQGDDANFATCWRCLLVSTDRNDARVRLLAASGTLEISEGSMIMSGVIQATLTNATFVEISIDPQTGHSTPVPNGFCAHVESMTFSYGL